jgi:hypothetical protein
MSMLAAAGDQKYTSLGLSGRAHILVFVVTALGALYVLRLLRRRQMRGKYTLLWMAVGAAILAIAAFPGIVDRTSRFLHIYYAPSTLFLVAIAFLVLVCVYFSYELSRLEERTRLLAEELAILRGERDADAGVGSRDPSP